MVIPPKIKILVVDDMVSARELIKNNLRGMGFKNFLEAENGTDAMKILKDHDIGNNKIEFIICDWNMPVKTGLEFLKEVRTEKKWANLPFLMITAETERDSVIQAVQSGVSQYLVKPFSGKDFEVKLNEAWAKHKK